MKFAAVIEYTPDKDKIAAVRPDHRRYLNRLYDEGRLLLAGPFEDDSGACLVYEADSLQQVEDWLRADPFAQQGVFVRWDIRPWRLVFINQLTPTRPA